MKITPAHFYLRGAGFIVINSNAACNRGTLASQSVVVSLSVPHPPPIPLLPGALRPKGSYVGITWSGCYPGGSVVPTITGQTYGAAVHLLRLAGLTWTCNSVGTTTTTRAPTITTTRPPTTTTTRAPTTTTNAAPSLGVGSSLVHLVASTAPPQTVLSQNPTPGTVLAPGTPVAMTMHACPL